MSVSQWVWLLLKLLLPCSIPTFSTPKERMVAILRYFLSSFHAARKVSKWACPNTC